MSPIRSMAPTLPAPAVAPAMREPLRELTQSLRAGDLDGARAAYADMVRNRPEGATWKPGSPFADLGKALVQGDMQAARAAYADGLKSHLPAPAPRPVPEPVPLPVPASVPSSTGGASGSLLNTVA